LGETVDYVKTELMPDFDFDAFNHDNPMGENGETEVQSPVAEVTQAASNPPISDIGTSDNGSTVEIDKW
jgi:hypothetical protein